MNAEQMSLAFIKSKTWELIQQQTKNAIRPTKWDNQKLEIVEVE